MRKKPSLSRTVASVVIVVVTLTILAFNFADSDKSSADIMKNIAIDIILLICMILFVGIVSMQDTHGRGKNDVFEI